MVLDIDYPGKHVLVVDDHPGMRASIRATLGNFGVVRTDLANNAQEATRRVRQEPYDIIISDYHLGEGRDGQQLLEELRHARLIPPSTVFLMVTAEAGYEKVMTAAEVAPDDYLIKPFTAELLHQRLNRILRRKAAFAAIHQAMNAGKVEQAVTLCDQLIAEQPALTVEAIRLKAELLSSIGQFEHAQRLYEQVIALRPLPWARLGLAKTLMRQGQTREAETLLQALTAEAPDYLAAYDLLARVQSLLNRPREAQETLQRAVRRSPNTLPRLKNLGEVAFANRDYAVAEQAYAAVVEKGVHSALRSPGDHARLARAQVDQNKLTQAGATLKALRAHYPNDPKAEFAALVVESLKETRAGHAEAAAAAVDKALTLNEAHGLAHDEAMTLDLARACLGAGREDQGKRLVTTLVHSNHEDGALLDKARNLFAELGRPEDGEQLVRDSIQAAVTLNNRAVRMAQQGDIDGAVELLEEAAGDLPDNVLIRLNTAHALLTLIQQRGWDAHLAARARDHLNQAKQRNAEHPKLAKVIGLFRDLAKQHGVMN